MVVNSLIIGLITYAAAVIYNLSIRRSLEVVFYLGLKFLIYTTLMTLFLQLSYFLIKNYGSEAEFEPEADQGQKEEAVSEAEQNETGEEVEAEQDFAESAVENEFESEDFSAFNPEEFDYQQNNN
ncbi:hypothetical protein ACTWKD_00500 [Halanaerobium saccharolyticum]|uniref:hypothetical protein n=1 Tax=Halanaerobium saccharolyticum TaxID=43595 RepID=UPI003FCC71BE